MEFPGEQISVVTQNVRGLRPGDRPRQEFANPCRGTGTQIPLRLQAASALFRGGARKPIQNRPHVTAAAMAGQSQI